MAQRIDNHTKTGGEHFEPKQKVAGGAEISPDIQKTCQELKVRRKHRVSGNYCQYSRLLLYAYHFIRFNIQKLTKIAFLVDKN